MFLPSAVDYAAPPVVMITAVTTTNVTIAWTITATCSTDDIIGYMVEISTSQYGLNTFIINTNETSVNITGLEEDVTYDCRVAKVTSAGNGTFSSSIMFTTLEAGIHKSDHNYTCILSMWLLCIFDLQIQLSCIVRRFLN